MEIEVFESGKVFVPGATGDAVVKLISPRDLGGCRKEAALNFRAIVGAAQQETLFDLLEGLRSNEYGMEAWKKSLEIGILFEGLCSLDVDIEEEVLVAVQAFKDILSLCAVETAVDVGMLDKGMGVSLAKKGFGGEKVVVLAVNFAWARGAGGGRYDPLEAMGKGLKKPVTKGCFSGARRAADDEKKRCQHLSVIQVFEDFPWA